MCDSYFLLKFLSDFSSEENIVFRAVDKKLSIISFASEVENTEFTANIASAVFIIAISLERYAWLTLNKENLLYLISLAIFLTSSDEHFCCNQTPKSTLH